MYSVMIKYIACYTGYKFLSKRRLNLFNYDDLRPNSCFFQFYLGLVRKVFAVKIDFSHGKYELASQCVWKHLLFLAKQILLTLFY